MAESLGNAYVNIIPKAEGIENELSDMFGGPAEKAGGTAGEKAGGGIMRSLGKVLSVAAVGKFLKDAFGAGADLQQSFGGLETIYGDAAGQAKEFAMQAAAAGISANDYAEQAVSFGASLKAAFGGDMVAATEAANTAIMDMADNAAKMGTPLENIQAAYQGFAKGQYQLLDNLKLGYGGTKTEMERLLADAQAITGVEYDIDNLGDVYDAIHVIQGELGLTGVAADEAKSTLSGSAAAMKASWQNVLAALTTGEGLDTAIGNLTDSFGAFATNIVDMMLNLAPQIPELIGGLVDGIIAMAPTFIESGVTLLVNLGAGLLKAIPTLLSKLPEIFSAIKNAFAGVDWMTLGKDIISGLIRGLSGMASELWNAIKRVVGSALDKAKEFLGIGSPSRVFADEVGRWIPAGVALGIDQNAAPLNSAVAAMSGVALNQFDRATAPGAVAGPVAAHAAAFDYERLADAISRRPVEIVGDSARIFKVVQKTNQVRAKATNYNALAMAPAGG